MSLPYETIASKYEFPISKDWRNWKKYWRNKSFKTPFAFLKNIFHHNLYKIDSWISLYYFIFSMRFYIIVFVY